MVLTHLLLLLLLLLQVVRASLLTSGSPRRWELRPPLPFITVSAESTKSEDTTYQSLSGNEKKQPLTQTLLDVFPMILLLVTE